ncbi:bifunctional diguanylate cyclase/phosphodiesterase [Thermopetrobacter sp. TC1]|uniref:putative bifunctional diguanylate cyclase/phosphodiesterase n=1 Tax=Thermopetrobacter sp. TC1 TaxID=1495045 RepID=UPI00068B2529|nr:bifunctional diguanylate cyclase/phosphodiesterase [Thermopetrobacter sp. TC1]
MHIEDGHRRVWRLTLALFALIFSATWLFGEHFVTAGVSRIMHFSAQKRVHDWLAHIQQEHRDVFLSLKDGKIRPYLRGRMQMEAQHYGIERFVLQDRKGQVLVTERIEALPLSLMHDEGPHLRVPPHLVEAARRSELLAASMSGDAAQVAARKAVKEIRPEERKKELIEVSRTITDENGAAIGKLKARVDLAELHAYIEDWVHKLVATTALAMVLIVLIAWLAYRMITAQSRKQIAKLAKEDELTGLANRRRCLEDLAVQLSHATEKGEGLAFILVNIDNFDRIASLHGPLAAERLLQVLAQRIRSVAEERALIYRFDSDNFAIIMPGAHEAEASRLGRILLATIGRPVQTDFGLLHPLISLGVVMVPQDADTVEQVVRRAAMVCWASMRKGGHGLLFYTPELEAVQARGSHMERLVKTALKEERLEMHFQPIVRMMDGRLHGFEALLRMRDENGDLVGPDEFIPVAEEQGMMEEFGAFALRESCRIAAQWPEHLMVAVNLSPLQFESGALPALVRDALRIAGLAPERLELEVTESLLLEDSRLVLDQLHALKAMGVRIALDDFGTGYSSLSYLWRFPFDKIKIDRTFIADMDKHKDVQTVLRATLAMARSMKLPVTAEGIEHEHQAAWLRRHHCHFGQGWLFGRPLPAEEVVNVIVRDRVDVTDGGNPRGERPEDTGTVEILAVHRQKRA